MRVLVTGGAGFIGSHLCRQLRRNDPDARLVVLDDLSTGYATNLLGVDKVDLIVGSVLDEGLVDDIAADVDAVVHLAAVPAVARSLENPRASHDVNATGTLVVLDAARRYDRYLVVASSSSVYGRGAAMPTAEDHPTRPASPYAASKLAAESYALSYARSFGLRVLALRFFNVFGPLQRAGHAYAAVIPAFVSAARRGQPVSVHGDGTQTRDFTYVGDVTRLIGDALSQEVVCDGPVNLAFGSRTSLLTLVSEIEDLLGHPVERSYGPPRDGDVHDSRADSTRLESLFPEARPTPLRQGLQATIEWFSEMEAAESANADLAVSG